MTAAGSTRTRDARIRSGGSGRSCSAWPWSPRSRPPAVSAVPALTGSHALTVLSGSMEPALPVGSVVVARPTSAEQIAVGDVITYTDRDPDSPATRVVTHRVVDIVQEPAGPTFGTKGDANDVDPGRPPAADVIGMQRYAVPWVGTVREGFGTPVGLFYAAGILLLLVAAHLLVPKTRQVRMRGHRR